MKPVSQALKEVLYDPRSCLVYGEEILFAFDHALSHAPGRSFPGLRSASHVDSVALYARHVRHLRLAAGDLLSLHEGVCQCLAFDARGSDALSALGLSAETTLDCGSCDADQLLAWVAAQGGDSARDLYIATIKATQDATVLRCTGDIDLWVINAASAQDVVEGSAQGVAWLSVKRAKTGPDISLPDPLGPVRDAFTVQRGTARAYELKPGEVVQIIDIEGQQCSDFTAFQADALASGQERMIDSTATRSMVRRAYPGPGLFDKFFDADMRPLLQVLQDTCGQHDTFGLACTARSYEDRGFPGHLNCSDNISDALAPYGVARRSAWPAINFFWRTWIDPATHHILTEESHSRPGDYVAMRAAAPLVCVTTACPDDVDPINGWNPTDVHVRIYKAETQVRRAVAYREKENAPMSLSHPSAFHARTEPLTSHFAPARDLWVPTSFPSTGALGEYWACRERATLQDMSGLRKFDIIGPDAERLLQQAMTKDIRRLALWRGTYALMCDELGEVIDDGTLFRIGPDIFRWCCGSEESGRVLEALARDLCLDVRIHGLGNSLPNLALQGPASRDILAQIAFTQPHVPSVDQMKWFGVTVARLGDREGLPFMLSRTGYTGELGYELFCAEADALELWDAVMSAGAPYGLTPMGNDALGMIRIEAGFAAAGAEFAPGADAFEAGLGFAVDLRKEAFTGRAALERNVQGPRKVLKGLRLESGDVPLHGAPVLRGERQVGVVTSATRSPTLGCAIAMVRLAVEHSETGTDLDVGAMDGRIKRLHGTVCDIPFVDPERRRARA